MLAEVDAGWQQGVDAPAVALALEVRKDISVVVTVAVGATGVLRAFLRRDAAPATVGNPQDRRLCCKVQFCRPPRNATEMLRFGAAAARFKPLAAAAGIRSTMRSSADSCGVVWGGALEGQTD